MVNDWPHIGYSTTPDLHTVSEFLVKTKDKK
jgi:hypothetical protein